MVQALLVRSCYLPGAAMHCNLLSGSLITAGGVLPAWHRQRHVCRWAVANLPAPRQCGGIRKANAVSPLGTGRHASLNLFNLFTEVVQAPAARTPSFVPPRP